MPLFRRRPADPQRELLHAAFSTAAGSVDTAQRLLLKAVPTPRDPGVALDDALEDFLAALARAEAAMPGWRTPATEAMWQACAGAIEAARREALALRRREGPLGFEALNARLGEVTHHLDVFAEAARALRAR